MTCHLCNTLQWRVLLAVGHRSRCLVGHRSRCLVPWRVLLAKLLTKLITHHKPEFRCASIQLNRNYSSKLHTDKNNLGSSYIIGLGDYEGSRLCAYGSSNMWFTALASSIFGSQPLDLSKKDSLRKKLVGKIGFSAWRQLVHLAIEDANNKNNNKKL